MRKVNTLVIGSGAAGLAAALRLKNEGVDDLLLLSEGLNRGTSINTGSDKQTYYKLGIYGMEPDSPGLLGQTLFDGGSVHGDVALVEATLSVRCFMNLANLGVPFPSDEFGQYIGYKTDHDPKKRATSAGPLTSKYMTEALQKKAESLRIKVFDGYKVVKILKNNEHVCGLVCLKGEELVAFHCADIVMATGGPAGIYADNVYPECHTGSTGLAIEAGAKMQNLALWQYGLASTKPRWNVSGTYMQVLPRFVSIDKNGNEYDFLWDYFSDKYHGLSLVFLKGYQWPFDPKKAEKGSSLIDMLVYRECVEKGRKVFLDFTKNPFEIDFTKLTDEAYEYLSRAGSTSGTPIERLQKMNAPAIELYKSKGVDLRTEYLPIALCAQHNNGGIAVDMWWQSSVKGLFAVGECAGTHGIARPGGSALNAGQVGSLRAAQYISEHPNKLVDEGIFLKIVNAVEINASSDTAECKEMAQRRMSDNAAAVRDIEKIKATLVTTLAELKSATDPFIKDVLLTQGAVLTAMSQPNTDPKKIQEIQFINGEFKLSTRDVRPIPQDDAFFENVWRNYRENKNIF